MNSDTSKIYNVFTVREKIVLLLISLLLVAQPFDFINKSAWIALVCVGILILISESSIFKHLVVRQLALVSLLLFIPGVLSYWNTSNVEKTTVYVLQILGMFLVGVSMCSLFRHKKMLELLSTVIAITSFAWIFDGFIQYFFGKDLLGIPLNHGRVVGPFLTSTHMGTLLSLMIPVVLKWLERFRWWSMILYLASLATILIFTGVRTDWVTYLAALILYFAWSKKGRILFATVIIPMVIIIVWITISSSSFAKNKVSALAEHGIPNTYNEWNNFLSKRLDIWTTGLHMFEEHPVVGIGARGFTSAYQDYRSADDYFDESIPKKNSPLHIHHPWFSILAETGTVGFVCFLGIVFFLFGITARSKWGIKLYSHPWLITLMLIANPCNSMPPFYKTWLLPIVLLALVAHLSHLHDRSSSINK
jgi:O-antigen ligase